MFEVPIDKVASIAIRNDKFGVTRTEKILTITYDGGAALFSGEEQKLYRIQTKIENMVSSLKEEELLKPDKAVEKEYTVKAA